MIIKSMSRKSTSFHQLYSYMNNSPHMGDTLIWNIHRQRKNQLLHAFYKNASLLPAHAKGNVLYHEIISLKRCSTIPLERQQKALYDLCHKYLLSRGKDLLAYGKTHLEKEHLHMHLMLSANALHQSKRHRLSKGDFRAIQQQCEQYIQQTYPELQQPSVYCPEQEPNKVNEPTQPKKKPQPSSSRDHVKSILRELLEQERTISLEALLKQNGFILYQRGKNYAVSYCGQNYRIKSLGLEEAFLQSTDLTIDEKTAPQAPSSKRRKELEKLHKYYQQVEQDLDNPSMN